MAGNFQRELIETEMARLIGDLQQLERVRKELDTQVGRFTVGHYLMNGGIRGRYFKNNLGIYQVTEILKNGSIAFASTRTLSGERIAYGLGDILGDMEASLGSESK